MAVQDRPQSPFAAGSIDQPTPRSSAGAYRPVEAPRPFWGAVEGRANNDRLAERVAREEATVQGALVDRHRQIETLLGRPVPRSLMIDGQGRDGAGAMSDADYEARIDALRKEFPNRLSGIETRAEMAARLSGNPEVTYYETSQGPASVRTRSDGSLWLETRDGVSGPLSRFPGARPVRRAAAGDTSTSDGTTASPRVRSLGERVSTTFEDIGMTSPVMALGRLAVGGGYDEFEDPENPGQTIRYATFGQQARDYERERRDSYRLMAQSDAWNAGDASALHKLARGAATLSGALGGAALDPTSAIAPGSTVAGRVVGSVTVNAATDALTQGADIGAGIESEYRPEQTAAAAVLGGVVQGAGEGASALARATNQNPGGVVGALAAEIDIGSRAYANGEAPKLTTPAVRAALARVDRERQDVLRYGAADGPTAQAVEADLDALRVPRPLPAAVERELEDLFGDAAPTPARPAPDAGEATPGPSAPAGLEATEYQGRTILQGSFDPMAVDADPSRFQFKQAGDEDVTDRLTGVTKWDQTAAGRSILYEEPDGRVVIADGHQRRALARRLIESGEDTTPRLDGFLMRSRDGWSPSEVRMVAALKNLREGSGSLLDAAKVLREAPQLVNDRSLPVTGEFLNNARGLAKLADDAFDAVSAGVISERNGSVIGELTFDRPDLHLSMVDLIRAGEPRSLDESRALVQEARLADFVESQGLTGDLFGGPPAQSTLIARAQLRAAVLKQLRGDAKLFGSLVRNADAIEAGGNALARTENEAGLARDMVAYSQIDKLALRVGHVGDTFGEAAAAITRGELTMAKGTRSIVDELRASSDLADAVNAERRVNIDPDAPNPQARMALADFDRPGGVGQKSQIPAKPEDVEAEARASQAWDDLPEVGEEQRALDVLRVCAPAGA